MRTVTGVRLEVDDSNGATPESRWVAIAFDVEANVSWFDATGSTPLLAMSRLAQAILDAFSEKEWELTDVRAEAEKALNQ